MSRSVDWIEGYLAYTNETEPARIFQKWSALSVIASALRKKVNLALGRLRVYPNLYVVFVAEPGVARKTQAISYALEFFAAVPDITISADATTREAMLEDLESSARDDELPDGTMLRHASITVASKEFESFIGHKKENTRMLTTLTDLFDANELPWKYRAKISRSSTVPSVFINIIAGTTPTSIANQLPVSAIGGGLASRIIYVWAETKHMKSPRPPYSEELALLKEVLIADLFQISRMTGTYEMTEDCGKKFDEWYYAYDEVDPCRICRDPSFNGWYSRKPMYLLKVAMLCAAAQSNELVLEWKHYERAISFIEEAEKGMGNVFKALGRSEVAADVDTVVQIVKTIGRISDKELLSRVWKDMDEIKFNNVIATAIRAGKIKRVYEGNVGSQIVFYVDPEIGFRLKK